MILQISVRLRCSVPPCLTVASVISVLALTACGPPAGSSDRSRPAIQVTEISPGSRVVDVVGLDADALSALSKAGPEERAAALRVHVEGAAVDTPAMSGSYDVVGDRLRFTPAFPLDQAVAYHVVFQRSGQPSLELAVPARARATTPVTRVIAVYPPDTLLENHLRLYIHFSGPMSNRGADTAIRLLDDRGDEVKDPFLPVDVHLWNEDRTRYTLLFDPGRVKRGILPNMEQGRALARGRTYTLVVDREWRDAGGRPLVETFRRDYRVVPELVDPIVPDRWRMATVHAGSREPMTVTFPRPLDHALAQRMLFVTTPDGRTLDGAVDVDPAATTWTFTPKEPWKPGDYRLRALSELEDPAGNRIGRAFDYDAARAGESMSDKHAEASLHFTVR
jgi:hypothetical protein